MMSFVPVSTFVIVSFVLLGAFVSYSNPQPALVEWLFLARLAAWIVALAISTVVFLPAIIRHRLRTRGSTFFAALSIMIFYPCDGFLRAYAEERIIRYNYAHPDPSDDMGPHYIYGSFSPGAGGSSRGASDAARYAWQGFKWGSVFAVIWLPFVFFIAWLVFRHAAPASVSGNA